MTKFQSVISYFAFTKQQRVGVLILLFLIICLQTVIFFYDWQTDEKVDPREKSWTSLQGAFDTLKSNSSRKVYKVYKFNPNFISDYKGYRLGMSVAEIDRLLAF
ncbi:MAG: helix-hairpin-helix domain-containing protein, partial [Flavobacterium sp.]